MWDCPDPLQRQVWEPNPQHLPEHTLPPSVPVLSSAVGAGSGHPLSVENNSPQTRFFSHRYAGFVSTRNVCLLPRAERGSLCFCAPGAAPRVPHPGSTGTASVVSWRQRDASERSEQPGELDLSCRSRKLLAPKMFSCQWQGSWCHRGEGRWWVSLGQSKVLCCHLLENSAMKHKDVQPEGAQSHHKEDYVWLNIESLYTFVPGSELYSLSLQPDDMASFVKSLELWQF